MTQQNGIDCFSLALTTRNFKSELGVPFLKNYATKSNQMEGGNRCPDPASFQSRANRENPATRLLWASGHPSGRNPLLVENG